MHKDYACIRDLCTGWRGASFGLFYGTGKMYMVGFFSVG